MTYYFSCPQCGHNGEFYRVQRQGDDLGCLIFLLGGWLLTLLYLNRMSQEQVQCGSCGYIFRKPELPASPTAKWLTAVIGLAIAGFIAFLILLMVPEATTFVESDPAAGALSEAVAQNPGAALLAFIPTCLLICAVSFTGMLIANRRYHRELGDEYRITPMDRREP